MVDRFSSTGKMIKCYHKGDGAWVSLLDIILWVEEFKKGSNSGDDYGLDKLMEELGEGK